MEITEIKLKIIPQEDGGTKVKMEMDANIKMKTIVVALEMGKQQLFESFSKYCDENNISDSKIALGKYDKIIVKEFLK